MGLNGLQDARLKLILFGGKGGVGKTTCAFSTGFYLSDKGLRTLLVSTDPAHSLSDSIGQSIGPQIKSLDGAKHLYALELSAEESLSKFKIEHHQEIRTIFQTSTYFDDEDMDAILELAIPGIDEVMGFKTIIDLIEEGKFDKYIVDTAPSGHALRLLSFPELLDEWIKVIAKMRWKYRYMVSRFKGAYEPDSGDDLLVIMKKTVSRIKNLLKDKSQCEFIVVTIPEYMAVSETTRLVNTLTKYGIQVKQMIINNVMHSDNCSFCQTKKEQQQKYVQDIYNKFAHLNITKSPLQSLEVRGIEQIKHFANILFNETSITYKIKRNRSFTVL